MRLFGLLATIFTGGTLFVDSVKDGSLDTESRNRARENNSDTWIDSHGNMHLTSTGEKVFSHDYKLKSVKDGRVIIDYREKQCKEINRKNIEEAKTQGKKFVRLSYSEFGGKYYYTEISTMKRYYLIRNGYTNPASYKKVYYASGRKFGKVWDDDPKEESIDITRAEFMELGGFISGKPYTVIGKYIN